jgi:hypothetical protein
MSRWSHLSNMSIYLTVNTTYRYWGMWILGIFTTDVIILFYTYISIYSFTTCFDINMSYSGIYWTYNQKLNCKILIHSLNGVTCNALIHTMYINPLSTLDSLTSNKGMDAHGALQTHRKALHKDSHNKRSYRGPRSYETRINQIRTVTFQLHLPSTLLPQQTHGNEHMLIFKNYELNISNSKCIYDNFANYITYTTNNVIYDLYLHLNPKN